MKTRVLWRLATWLPVLISSSHVYAQCAYLATGGWPTDVTFDPASPNAGEAINVVLGPPASVQVDPYSVSVNGTDVYINGEFYPFMVGVPPPPAVVVRPLGSILAGTYDVHIRLHYEDGTPCPEVAATLVVGPGPGGAPVGAPASGLVALTCLTLGILAIGWTSRRRGSGSK